MKATQSSILFLFLFCCSPIFAQQQWMNYTSGNYINDIFIDGNKVSIISDGVLVNLDVQTGQKEFITLFVQAKDRQLFGESSFLDKLFTFSERF